MSYAWSFYSFSVEQFQHYFGQAKPEEVEQMVAAATWEVREYGGSAESGELASIERVVRHIALTGLSYAGLSAEDARILDESMAVLFSTEGLEEALEIGPESPDGIGPGMIEELLRRAEGRLDLRYLPMLRYGRRYGSNDPDVRCGYVLLYPDQLQPLLDEITNLVALPLEWSNHYVAKVIDECLVRVLQTLIPRKQGLAAFLG